MVFESNEVKHSHPGELVTGMRTPFDCGLQQN